MRKSGNYIYMIMLTRSSERIFNPNRHTGKLKYIVRYIGKLRYIVNHLCVEKKSCQLDRIFTWKKKLKNFIQYINSIDKTPSLRANRISSPKFSFSVYIIAKKCKTNLVLTIVTGTFTPGTFHPCVPPRFFHPRNILPLG